MPYDSAHLPPNIRAGMDRKPEPLIKSVLRAGRVPLSRALPDVAGPEPEKAVVPTPAQERWQTGEERKLSDLVVTELRRRGCAVLRARTDQKSTIAKGWPDLTVLRNGKSVCIELKSGNGKLSQAQVECHAELAAAGVPVTTAYTFDHAVSFAVSRLFP